MMASSHASLSLRSYGADGALHRHAHVQIVLPLQGQMEIEIGGRGDRLDLSTVAFVAPDIDHAQSAQGPNRFLILDCQRGTLDEGVIEQLRRQIFVPVSQPLRRLLEFIDLRSRAAALPDLVVQHCAPLLLDALMDVSAGVSQQARRPRRLADLLARMQAAPEQPWTVSHMARAMPLSVSRLHALFRSELQQTPQEWLAAMRLRLVRQALASTDLPLAELALRHGYASQSTLTRVMRRATGMTPAAYRKQQRQ
jgi:AraC-like DNA-binding protein